MDACTHLTPRCPNARDYQYEIRDCCRQHVRLMMSRLAPMLDKAGVTWLADYGTLLGAVRNPMTTWEDYPWLSQEGRDTEGPEPGIVPHDKDADIGVLYSDWPRLKGVRVRLIREFNYSVTANPMRGSMKARVSSVNLTNTDIFAWHERRERRAVTDRQDPTMYRAGYAKVDEFKGREFPKSMLFPLSTVQWEGLTLPAPRDPEAFLEMRYGPNWRTPIMANNDGVTRGQWNGKRNSRG